MKILVTILWCFVFIRALFFWLWLWQLKEYHWGRFRAHFEAQKVRKLISTFYRVRFPRLTKKTVIISFFGILLTGLIIFELFELPLKLFYISLLVLFVLSPLIFSSLIIIFQIPTIFLRNRILKKAKEKREKFKSLSVIAVTGSYGKTSTKEFLAEILSDKFKVLKTERHVNAEIGIAQTILEKLNEEHQIFIAEVGAYEVGKIKEVCEFLQPEIGILTGISEQHLSTFGSQQNIIRAKYELIESLPDDGLAVFNGNNKYCRELYQKTKIPKKISVVRPDTIQPAAFQQTAFQQGGFQSADELIKPDIWAENVKEEKEEISFKVFSKKESVSADFRVKIIGIHNVENILMAAIVAEEFGMSLVDVSRACDKLTSLAGALRLLEGNNRWNILDATYSANPQGIISHLDYLKIWSREKGIPKKVIVMPCLIELGFTSKEIHKKIGEKIGKVCDLAIITTKDRLKELRKGAEKSGMNKENIVFLSKEEKIFEKLKNFCPPESVILLESRVPRDLIKMLIK